MVVLLNSIMICPASHGVQLLAECFIAAPHFILIGLLSQCWHPNACLSNKDGVKGGVLKWQAGG